MARGAIPSLDLYLAATMRRTPRLFGELAGHGITEMDLVQAEAWAGSEGLLDPATLQPDHVRTAFGTPVGEDSEGFWYGLSLWPAHIFRWRIGDAGFASPEGFRLVAATTDWLGRHSLDERLGLLKTWFHTRHEVLDGLGAPAADTDWGHLGEWYYGPLASGTDALLFFDYELLTEIRLQPGLIPRAR